MQPLDPSRYWVALYSQSVHCPLASETSSTLKHTGTGKKTKKKPTTPSKGFNLKCSRKCLIQRRMQLDCPIIHLCIFSGRQTAESFWYHVRFLGLSVSLSRRKRKGRRGSKERRLQRQTRGYSRAHSGVRLCVSVCVCSWTRAICLLKKAFNRAFISPSMVS